jgi:hypothetical protein
VDVRQRGKSNSNWPPQIRKPTRACWSKRFRHLTTKWSA